MGRVKWMGCIGLCYWFLSCGGATQTAVRLSDEEGSCEKFGTLVDIGNNHGHGFFIESAEITAAEDVYYDITFDADHTHTALMDTPRFEQLQQGEVVSIQSSVLREDFHRHLVSVHCIAGDTFPKKPRKRREDPAE